MNLLGKHLIATVAGGPVLDDAKAVQDAMIEACVSSGATVLHSRAHKFEPQGVTVIVMLAESHFSIHTWPERGTGCLDVFTCGDVDPNVILQHFVSALNLGVQHRSILARMG